jgi:creatinine amidohydrolase
MRAMLLTIVALGLAVLPTAAQTVRPRGVVLGDLTWVQAQAVLKPDAVVIIPLGAGCKEHGPHLRLDNDQRTADYLADRVLAAADVIVAPAINYHYYPAFIEYPGSASLAFETARDLVIDIVRSLAAYGPRRFYVLNTGISPLGPLQAAAQLLRRDGILLRYTDIAAVSAAETKRVQQQTRGSHADEIETSMMLYIAPERVNMRLAVRDDNVEVPGPLTRKADGKGTYSPSGVWGDATLATREKGRVVVEATVTGLLRDIATLRSAALP